MNMKKILIILIVIVITGFFIYNSLRGRFYSTISHEDLVGVIRCAKPTDKNYSFYLFYFPVTDKRPKDFVFLKMNGKEWIFEGEIIKWKRPLNFLGLTTSHRPIKIYDLHGNYCPLGKTYKKILFGLERLFPVVDTNFISLVKQTCSTRHKFGIFVTNSGYLVRKIK
jgi:hypothetical protein